jgi:hypothetical protein
MMIRIVGTLLFKIYEGSTLNYYLFNIPVSVYNIHIPSNVNTLIGRLYVINVISSRQKYGGDKLVKEEL